ncbi:hypothetical protein JB92DRAFT_3144028 [Gautieria morchelliformis]|nr:hypothetical protein JB92DRAFT_3144028 [Gautieria morchelliformis]
MTHEHLGLNITPPPSQSQHGQRAEQSTSPSGAAGRRPAHQRSDQLRARPPSAVRSREPPIQDNHLPRGVPPTNMEMVARLREQEDEILRLKAQIAAAGSQHRQQQLQPQPQPQPQQQPQPNPPSQHAVGQPPAQEDGRETLFADSATVEQQARWT